MKISELRALPSHNGVANAEPRDGRSRAFTPLAARRSFPAPVPAGRPGGAVEMEKDGAVSNPANHPDPPWQREFLARIDPLDHLHALFDLTDGLCLFIKSAGGRIIFANECMKRHFRARGIHLVEGRNDAELFPGGQADLFRRDDRRVMRTGQPLVNRVEMFFDEAGVPAWASTTKVPLRDRTGAVIGLVALTRVCPGLIPPSAGDLTRALEILMRDLSNPPTIPQLARASGLSLRHLQRRFKQVFGFGPRDYSLRCRLRAALQLLPDARLSLADIAQRTGFRDQSAFTQAFRKLTGLTPGAQRRKFHQPALSRA